MGFETPNRFRIHMKFFEKDIEIVREIPAILSSYKATPFVATLGSFEEELAYRAQLLYNSPKIFSTDV